jgi:hypothetical protein
MYIEGKEFLVIRFTPMDQEDVIRQKPKTYSRSLTSTLEKNLQYSVK